MSTAILLIAHGSRQSDANEDSEYLVAELVRREKFPIGVAAFLELAEPCIEDGGRRCVELGATQVVMLPHFLSAGVHVRRDLAAARDALSAAHPQVQFRLAEPLGRHPLLLTILAERANAARENVNRP